MKTTYLLCIDCEDIYTDLESTYREIEIEHPDDGLDGLYESHRYVESLCDEKFKDLINAIKPKYFEASWTRDITIWEYTGEIELSNNLTFFLFCINISKKSDWTKHSESRLYLPDTVKVAEKYDYKQRFLKHAKYGF